MKYTCPGCGNQLQDDFKPLMGDIALCMKCGEVGTINASGELESLTVTDMVDFMLTDPRYAKLLETVLVRCMEIRKPIL